MTLLERRVTFSSGHRYWLADLSPGENRALFGEWASPYNHGHNYVLWLSVSGEPDPRTGMVVNIKDIDAILKERIVAILDQRSLNDEVPWFAARAPSLENLLVYCRQQVEPHLPAQTTLAEIRIEETETLSATLRTEPTMITLTRSYEFAASHRLHSPDLTPEENLEAYGKCNNPNGHGHNYVLEVTVTGEPDPRSGMLADLSWLDRQVHAEVVDRYDHRNLDKDLAEFQGRVTTSEVVASEIFSRLDRALGQALVRVRLLETARNAFEVSR